MERVGTEPTDTGQTAGEVDGTVLLQLGELALGKPRLSTVASSNASGIKSGPDMVG